MIVVVMTCMVCCSVPATRRLIETNALKICQAEQCRKHAETAVRWISAEQNNDDDFNLLLDLPPEILLRILETFRNDPAVLGQIAQVNRALYNLLQEPILLKGMNVAAMSRSQRERFPTKALSVTIEIYHEAVRHANLMELPTARVLSIPDPQRLKLWSYFVSQGHLPLVEYVMGNEQLNQFLESLEIFEEYEDEGWVRDEDEDLTFVDRANENRDFSEFANEYLGFVIFKMMRYWHDQMAPILSAMTGVIYQEYPRNETRWFDRYPIPVGMDNYYEAIQTTLEEGQVTPAIILLDGLQAPDFQIHQFQRNLFYITIRERSPPASIHLLLSRVSPIPDPPELHENMGYFPAPPQEVVESLLDDVSIDEIADILPALQEYMKDDRLPSDTVTQEMMDRAANKFGATSTIVNVLKNFRLRHL